MATTRAERARRRAGARDPLGLRRAMSDRLLQALIAAMALLAALAFAGAQAADSFAERWRSGAESAVTVQVPDPSLTRMALALGVLSVMPEVAEANPVDADRLAELLRPWLGDQPALPLPGVIEVRLRDLNADVALIGDKLAEAVPGAVTEAHGVWVARLAALANGVRGLALAALGLVALIAIAVVAVAVRAGISARQESVLVLHQLGATGAEIAGRFARRAAVLAICGGAAGAVLAVPAFFVLARLAQPFADAAPAAGLAALPWEQVPWADLALVPLAAAAIGWLTAQVVVRRWLARLP
ncbi:MAG TPA: FtsX-like permease family protein [Roseomonas sp.]